MDLYMDMEDIEKDMEEIGETEEVRFFKYLKNFFFLTITGNNFVIIVIIISCENKVTLILKVLINKLKRNTIAVFFSYFIYQLV